MLRRSGLSPDVFLLFSCVNIIEILLVFSQHDLFPILPHKRIVRVAFPIDRKQNFLAFHPLTVKFVSVCIFDLLLQQNGFEKQ